MQFIGSWLTAFICLVACSISSAATPGLGAEISVAVAQKLLGSPPLPSLEGDGFSIAPQYGYVEVEVVQSDVLNETNFSYDGRTTGNTAGLSVSSSAKSGWGFFAFGVTSKIKGNSNAYVDGTPSYSVSNIRSSSLAGAAGLSYRFLGSDKSTLALGAFTGPAFISVASTSDYSVEGQPGVSGITFNPSYKGLYSGLQLSLRLGIFRINPYMIYFATWSPQCQPLSTSGSGPVNESSFSCNNERGKLETHASFPGLGLFLGVGSLRMNVASTTVQMAHLRIRSYSASLGIGF